MLHQYRRDGFSISTDPKLLDINVIHSFLVESYWARGVPRELVVTSIENSLCFGLYRGNDQIGFARVVTDYAFFAYLMDVFVLQAYQGRGLGQWLIECVVSCPSLQGIKQILLATRDAQDFYRKKGFTQIPNPERLMVIRYDRPWFVEG
jgi:GNAT superfamily N-acetyltransferase